MYNAQNISWIGDYTVSNGSSALKVSLPSNVIISAFQGAGNTNPDLYPRTLGKKKYEINDHLGNVRSVVSDIKLSTLSSTYVPKEFHADILAACNYYAFGMEMPGRSYSSNSYRYGFGGQEKDDEIKGSGNSLVFKYRMHDPRLGRFLSVDPLAPDYPWNSPYAFAENRVIDGVELEGAEYLDSDENRIRIVSGEVRLEIVNFNYLFKANWRAANANPKNWKAGEIGISDKIGNLSLLTPQPKPKVGKPNSGIVETKAVNAKSTGSPDKRVKPRILNSTGSSKGLAKGLIAVDVINYLLPKYIGYMLSSEVDRVNDQSSNELLSAIKDLNTAIQKGGYIDKKYLNITDLSGILNVILVGYNTTENEDLHDIGVSILKNISKKYRGDGIEPIPSDDGTTLKKDNTNVAIKKIELETK